MFTTRNWLWGWGAVLLLAACEQQPNASGPPTVSPYLPKRAPQPNYSSGFKGIDPEDYELAKAERVFGRYLLVPPADPELSHFSAIFYQPSPDSAWQEVGAFKLDWYNTEPEIDTVNIDKQGAAELIVRSESSSYGSGGGSTCYTLSLFRCGKEITKVLAVPVMYADETFVTFQGEPGHYEYTQQSVRPQRGRIKVGKIEKKGLDCEKSDCEGCAPRLKPGIYRLVGDTVVRVAK